MNRLHLFILLYVIAVCVALLNGYKYSEVVKENNNLKAKLISNSLMLGFCKRQLRECRSKCFYSRNGLFNREEEN